MTAVAASHGGDPAADLAALRVLLIALIEAPAGSALPAAQEWLNDRQWLAKKFLMHLISVEGLARGETVTIDDVQHFHIDHSSMAAVARALLENFLVFAWIFGAADMELARFRNRVWRQSGLQDRVKRTGTTREAKEKQAKEKLEMAELRKEIVAHPHYATLDKKQREALFEDWKKNRPWHSLAVMAGLHITYFRNAYSYLSDHAHTSYAGALQVGQADQAAQRQMARSIIGMVALISAHFIRIYVKAAPITEPLLEGSPARAAFNRWLIEAEHLENFYGDAKAA